jgi:hypothetical protein
MCGLRTQRQTWRRGTVSQRASSERTFTQSRALGGYNQGSKWAFLITSQSELPLAKFFPVKMERDDCRWMNFFYILDFINTIQVPAYNKEILYFNFDDFRALPHHISSALSELSSIRPVLADLIPKLSWWLRALSWSFTAHLF